MPNEINLTLSATLTNGSARDRFDIGGQKLIDQANPGIDGGIVAIATAETEITFDRLTTEGLLFLQNLDADNFVDYGPDSGGSMVPIGRLNPGEFAAFRLKPGITLKAQADTDVVNLLVKCWED